IYLVENIQVLVAASGVQSGLLALPDHVTRVAGQGLHQALRIRVNRGIEADVKFLDGKAGGRVGFAQAQLQILDLLFLRESRSSLEQGVMGRLVRGADATINGKRG